MEEDPGNTGLSFVGAATVTGEMRTIVVMVPTSMKLTAFYFEIFAQN
jgi:limonene-1,2-epoxide hydrolase